ncbi:MAG TPA: hypothetical protein VHU92_23100 [Streptosporangiaceae bacterium]|jgi:hypothetical protein|nr:hypothetical protein [Streptosporangiaceae bacterium]
MTESAVFHTGLERGYRRLLAAYPQSFRREQEEEMLAVLMAGTQPGQRRPGLAEAVDVIVSGLRMRLRRAGSESASRGWVEALAVFSVIAPLAVLLTTLLTVLVPYHLPPASHAPWLFRWSGGPRELDGPSLLHLPTLDIVLGIQVIIVVLVLLGRRRLALVTLAAAALFWLVTGYAGATGFGTTDSIQAVAASAYALVAVALAVSPDTRQVRRLLGWRHAVVLLLAVAAVEALELVYDASSSNAQTGVLVRATAHSAVWKDLRQPGISGYVIAAIVLGVVAAGLAVAFRLSRYFLLLLVLLYPVALELGAAGYRDTELIGLPTPGHLAVLFVPPAVVLAGIVIGAYPGLRPWMAHGRAESA